MNRDIKFKLLLLIFFVFLQIFLIIGLLKVLNPIHFIPQNLFFFELINKTITLPFWTMFVFETGILILFWLISQKIFTSRFFIIPISIWVISPWNYYLAAANSFYICILFFFLIVVYGLTLLYFGKKKIGMILISVGSIILFYSSIFFLIILPVIFVLITGVKLIKITFLKNCFLSMILLSLPLFMVIVSNHNGFKNIITNEVKIFSDPDLLNTVNRYQGAAQDKGLKNLARISENKYIFFTEYAVFKYIKQLIPPTFFTSNERLLGFSFSPPLFLGFLIPLIYGLYKLFRIPKIRILILISTILTIPSILSGKAVDLNRLIIFAPIIVFVISYGLVLMIQKISDRKVFLFLTITIILIIFQTAITINDISMRESKRFNVYFGQLYSLGNQ